MARQLQPRVSTPTSRRLLQARDAPYWSELHRGLRLGYVKSKNGTAGVWVVREFKAGPMGERGGYVRRRLGLADDLMPADGTTVLTYADARDKAIAADRPTITNPGKLLVSDAADAYFATRAATTPHDRITWTTFIAPQLGSRFVGELTTGDLERWLHSQVRQTEDREERRAARATANRRWSVLRAILNSAFRKDPARVPSDGAWRRVRPFAKADRPRTRTLTTEECKKLLSKLEAPLHSMAQAALCTGLRLGELEALQAADVGRDFVRVRISKSGRPRTVPLNEEGAQFFAGLVNQKTQEDLVFDRITRMKVSREMRAGCEAAEILPPAVFHDLRRTYGSLLLNEDVASDAIQDLLGHADQRMTRRTYAHIADATLQKAVQKLPSFTGESVKKQKHRRRSS
jgi:integrase